MFKSGEIMPEEIRRGGYLITICCKEMRNMIRWAQAIPVEEDGETVLVVKSEDFDPVLLAKYCWNCGEKVQIKKVE